MGEQLGPYQGLGARIVRQVGNYGEVFERNVGVGSRSAFRAGSTICGTTAASSTRRRCNKAFAAPAAQTRA